jgi:nicotinate-nucleotide adenylyltransferase
VTTGGQDASVELELPPRAGTYRLGVFGSMFDPPHLGHRAAIDAAWSALDLDRVVAVPAGIPPHRTAPVAPPRRRLQLAVRAFADLPHVVVSGTEVERGEAGEVGYMVDTVAELVAEPAELGYMELQVEPWLVVGADQLASLEEWHRWRELLSMANVAVVTRPGQVGDAALGETAAALGEVADASIRLVPMPPVDVSSTAVRDAARRGARAEVGHMVPAPIVDDVLATYGAEVAAPDG